MDIQLTTKPRPLGKPLRASAAFSIIEVLVASAVAGIMFTSLYAGISYGFATMRVAREDLRATQILTEKLEVLRLCTWEQINSNGFIPRSFVAAYEPGGSTNLSQTKLRYTGSIRIEPPVSGLLPSAYSTDMRVLTVTVNWTSTKIPRSRTARSFVSRYGLQNYIIAVK